MLKTYFLTCRFIDKYLSLASQSPELASEQLVQSVTDALKAEGITLKTVEEIAKVADHHLVLRNFLKLGVTLFRVSCLAFVN